VPEGRWRAARFAVPFALRVTGPGWLSMDPTRDSIDLRHGARDAPGVSLSVPAQVFTASGGVAAVRGPEDLIRQWRRNPLLVTGKPRRTTFGGVPATSVALRASDSARRMEGCPTPCVPLLAWPKATAFEDTKPGGRYIVLRHRGRTIAISTEDDPVVDRLARTIRFE
jgi:hypothetical protein